MPHLYHLPVLICMVFFSCKPAVEKSALKVPGKVCSEPVSLNGVKGKVDPANTLRYDINFNTDSSTHAYVEFWESGHPDKKFHTKLSVGRKNHALKLYPLKAVTDYTYQIHLFNEYCQTASTVFHFRTGPLPEELPEFKLSFVDSAYKEKIFDGFIVTHKRTKPGYFIMLDADANICWYQQVERAITLSHWTKNRTIIGLLSDQIDRTLGDEVIEFDLEGNVVFQKKLGERGFEKMFHHDLILEGDRLLTLTREVRQFDLSQMVGGSEHDSVVVDGILSIHKNGKQSWEWLVTDVMHPTENPHIVNQKQDWTHANALFKDRDDNYLISFRNLNQVWKIDKNSGEVMWKLGIEGDFRIKIKELFTGQHAPSVTYDDDLLLLNNGLAEQRSGALFYKIDRENHSIAFRKQVNFPDSLFTPSQGNVTLIGSGHILFCSSVNKKIVVTDMEGRLLWMTDTPDRPYRAEYVNQIFRPYYLN